MKDVGHGGGAGGFHLGEGPPPVPARLSNGSLSTHGGHQVAQKTTRTTSPLRSSSRTAATAASTP